MRYPFEAKLRYLEETSYKLKILSVAEGRPITKVVKDVVDFAYNNLDADARQKAVDKVGEFRSKENGYIAGDSK
jgi:hypothetical protein